MTDLLTNSPAAGLYLARVFNAPVEAREAVDRIVSLPEHDRVLVLLHLAERALGSVSDAINNLPCFEGCEHRRHDGDVCGALYVDTDGMDRNCQCNTAPAPVVPTHPETPAEARAHEDRIDSARGAL